MWTSITPKISNCSLVDVDGKFKLPFAKGNSSEHIYLRSYFGLFLARPRSPD